jgi:hypothetical protein
MNKAELKKIENKLLELTGAFCTLKLDDEYLQLSEKLIKKLGRKRNVPFESGKIEIWAASIIHALGMINFLFDGFIVPLDSIPVDLQKMVKQARSEGRNIEFKTQPK